MANNKLQLVGEVFANIGNAVGECVRQDSHNLRPHVEHFEEIMLGEVQRLRGLGEEGLAEAMNTVRPALTRLMREGW